MWLFIATEIVLFGGLFCLYTVLRIGNPELFASGSRLLDTGWGAINTGILIISSVMMALAVRSARYGRQRHTVLFLGLTFICAIDFLGVTYIEYRDRVHENLVWRPGTQIAHGALPPIEVQPGVATEGEAHYRTTCAACHGPAGEGLVNFGQPLTTSSFIAGLDDKALLDFLRTGRSIDDPLNTTGITMAPRGGNPLLTDQDLAHVVAFVRTLQTEDIVGEEAAEEVAKDAADEGGGVRDGMDNGSVVDPRFNTPQPANAHLFFLIYFLLTGSHAIHVLAGAGVLAWLILRARRGRFSGRHFTYFGLGGLYWYFLGIVWIIIFPLLYLIG